jgi:uncharacterized protein YcfJ
MRCVVTVCINERKLCLLAFTASSEGFAHSHSWPRPHGHCPSGSKRQVDVHMASVTPISPAAADAEQPAEVGAGVGAGVVHAEHPPQAQR